MSLFFMSFCPFLKKNFELSKQKLLRPALDSHLNISPFTSSKLFVKFSRFRKSYFKYEKLSSLLKFLRLAPKFCRYHCFLTNFQFNFAFKNVCSAKFFSSSVFGGRYNNYTSKNFNISRVIFRNFAGFSLLPGITKSSW
jgi:hypothetical protein